MASKCVVCGSKENTKLVKPDVVVCNDCGFGKRTKVPAQNKLNNLYQKDYFDDKKGTDYEKDAKHRYKHLKKLFFPKAKILDFGCGMGQFSVLCKNNDLDVYAYDVNEYVVERLRKKEDIKAVSKPLSKSIFPKSHFDFIVTFDVIEHVKDTDGLLELFNYWLKPNGYLIITTPNIESWDAKLFGENWNSLQKYPQHIYFFSPESLRILLTKQGFSNIKKNKWGFVWRLGFVVDKEVWGKSIFISWFRKLLEVTKIGKVQIFFSMHNMMSIAKKR